MQQQQPMQQQHTMLPLGGATAGFDPYTAALGATFTAGQQQQGVSSSSMYLGQSGLPVAGSNLACSMPLLQPGGHMPTMFCNNTGDTAAAAGGCASSLQLPLLQQQGQGAQDNSRVGCQGYQLQQLPTMHPQMQHLQQQQQQQQQQWLPGMQLEQQAVGVQIPTQLF